MPVLGRLAERVARRRNARGLEAYLGDMIGFNDAEGCPVLPAVGLQPWVVLREAVATVDRCYVYDNSLLGGRRSLVISVRKGQRTFSHGPLPSWATFARAHRGIDSFARWA